MFECPRNGTLGARWLSALGLRASGRDVEAGSLCWRRICRNKGSRVPTDTQHATLKLTMIRLRGSRWVSRLQIPNEANIPKAENEQHRKSVLLKETFR